MLYTNFLLKSVKEVIIEADNGLSYLTPMWKTILIDNDLDVKNISDYNVEWSDIEDVLKLEVEKRNTESSLKPYVIKWVYDLITASIEPAILQQQTNMLEAMLKSYKEK